jgi:hypothetical protein
MCGPAKRRPIRPWGARGNGNSKNAGEPFTGESDNRRSPFGGANATERRFSAECNRTISPAGTVGSVSPVGGIGGNFCNTS